MGINFPSSPTVGQAYPSPSVPGLPQYVWDGTAWNSGAVFESYDKIADNNLFLNSGMEVSQEFGGTAMAKAGGWSYTQDQWNLYQAGSGTFIFEGQKPPPGTMPVRGFRTCLRLTCGSVYTMAGANDLISLAQPIEGNRVAKFAFGTPSALPVTINFWIYSTVVGNMSVGLRNGAGDRCYVTPVTINAAATWEYKSVTITGDIIGTWLTDTGIGANIYFSFGAGTGYQAAPNVWNGIGACWSHTGVTNFFSTINNQVLLTGMIMTPGSVGISAAMSPMMMRSFHDDLMQCLRYFKYHDFAGAGCWLFPLDLVSGYRRGFYQFNPPMRVAPVVAVTGVATGSAFNSGHPNAAQINQYSCALNGDLSGAGYSYLSSLKANARLN
jgi:hypothetical protein